jgi:cyclopropane fatty-acyl-phospholipid synthase-like methyltransferase
MLEWMRDMTGLDQGSPLAITDHQRLVRDFYDGNLANFLKLREESLVRNWGLWLPGTVGPEEAGINMITLALELAELSPQQHLLDVGCALGASSRMARARLPGGAVMGIDLSEVALARAQQDAGDSAEPGRLAFRTMSATALDFPAASFDRVLAIDCACHFDTRVEFFREASRVLRPGGRLVVLDIGASPGKTCTTRPSTSGTSRPPASVRSDCARAGTRSWAPD